MSGIDVPLSYLSGFVRMKPEMNECIDFVQRRLDLQIFWRRVEGIGVEHNQPLHLARIHVGDQILELFCLNRRQRIYCVGEDYCLTDIPQSLIDSQRSEMNFGSLLLSRNHQRFSWIG